MNIHITDKNLFTKLFEASIVKIEIGSRMYGLEHKGSDTDLLCIYNTSERELKSFMTSHHQLQYKKDGVDYLFINIHAFLRNTLSGDSTINFEVINSEKLIGTDLEFLYENRLAFYNYKIMRSYLGLAKRDVKRLNIDSKTEFDKNKKVAHVYRGFLTARKIFNSELTTLSKLEIYYIKHSIWNIESYKERKILCDNFMVKINELRNTINSELDKKNITTFMSIEYQKIIDENLSNITDKLKKMEDFDLSMFYDANENDVNY